MLIDDMVDMGYTDLSNVTAFLVQNVYEYIMDKRNNAESVWRELITMQITPPFETQWFEWVDKADPRKARGGLLLRATNVRNREEALTALDGGMLSHMRRVGYSVSQQQRSSLVRYVDSMVKPASTIITARLHIGVGSQVGMYGNVAVSTDQDGFPIIGHDGRILMITAGSVVPQDQDRVDAEKDYADTCLALLMMACGLMNCKNVSTVWSPPKDPRIQKARIRRNKQPFVQYKMIRIEKIGSTGRRELPGPGGEMPFHIVRGHFARYDEKPLFGKYRGTFWVPAHTRGSKENGEVVKDYELALPRK